MPVGFSSLPFVRMRVVKSDDSVGSSHPFQVLVIVGVVRRPCVDVVWVVAMVSAIAGLRVVGMVAGIVLYEVVDLINCSQSEQFPDSGRIIVKNRSAE